jgi:cytochrome P450
VLTDLLGLPHDEAAKIYQQSVAFNTVLAGVIDARRVENAERALRELRPSLSRLAVDPPPRSILARLRSAVVTGDLTEDELVASAVTLVAAGHETTTNLIANTLVALAGNPSVQDLAISSDVAAGRVVDEVLRFDAPVQLTAREASEDLVVAHEAISHGDRVVLLWGSANRDPATFQCPDAFDPGRPERLSALSFGVGPHHCPGSGLARMQAAMAVRALLQAVGPIRLSQEPSWRNSFAFRGPATLIAHRCRRLSADAGRTRSGRLT